MSYALGQMDRILGNLIKIGRIDSVDFDAGTATVDFDGELVADLEWSKDRAGVPHFYEKSVSVQDFEGDIVVGGSRKEG